MHMKTLKSHIQNTTHAQWLKALDHRRMIHIYATNKGGNSLACVNPASEFERVQKREFRHYCFLLLLVLKFYECVPF